MLELILSSYKFNLQYAQKLVADVPDERMCEQPAPGRVMNHAAFTIGHLAWVNSNSQTFLGGQPPPLVAEWKALFAPGNKPLAERTAYPSKEVLLSALETAHAGLLTVATSATPEQLALPVMERMRHRFNNMAELYAGLMTSHYASHLGQLSAWRRAMGFPSAF